MIVANPDFGGAANAGPATARDFKLKYQRGSQVATADSFTLANAYFPPLPGTAGEARALKALLPGVTVLTGAQATEAALKQMSSPDVLHIATHGFFLSDLTAGNGEGRELKQVGSSSEMPVNQQIENPLLRSGLALAGANLHKSGENNGVLTALEAAGLDLWGTKLVALSACDTGVGEVKSGDGVYGLRRALVLAGSESQVMSLWPVSARGTRDLMIKYYQARQKGVGRSAALREVQLGLLKRKERQHPYFWASFIQSGEWANLKGKR